MGKYSLESFERYQTVKCRPTEIREAIQGAGISAFETVSVVLGEAQPDLRTQTLLKISVQEIESIAETESKLRQFASRYYQDLLVLGVTLDADTDTASKRRLWEAAAEAFAPRRYCVPVHDAAQLDYALKHGFAKGLYVAASENIYDTCEAFAQNNAQQLYKQMPVLVSFAKGQQHLARYAQQWHATAVEGVETRAGWCIALRRLVYPRALSSGGYAPMRFWWTNRGPSFCHEDTEVRLRLERDGQHTPIQLSDHASCIRLADRVHNEIVQLPSVEPGIYRLEYGLFTRLGEPLVLAHEERNAEGYYPAGEMSIDHLPRPEYRNVWDDFFADGYYPLEDPQQPV